MDWQVILSMIIVAAAIFWLLRRAVQIFRGSEGSDRLGQCGSCGKSNGPNATPLVSIDKTVKASKENSSS
ncbi:MAG: hypothetical protein VX694_07100 [Planctomycetota bacterium]|nr:hypothetical protein [Planctomycetota bacterium]